MVITSIDLRKKIKLWLYSVYIVAFTFFHDLILLKFYLKKANFVFPDKPINCLSSNVFGNHMFIKVFGIKLHYVENGDCEKPLAVLLHGFLDCWVGWRKQLPHLKEHFRVIAVDMKGYGDSEKPKELSQYQVSQLVRELHGLIKALGESRCVMIGHDMGAMLGWFFASQYPDMVTKFVAISCPHPNVYWDNIPPGDGIFDSRFIHMCQLPKFAESQILRSNLAIIDNLYSHLKKTGEPEMMNAYKYVFSRCEDLTGPINYLRTFPLSRIQPGNVKCPTLLLVGSRDSLVSVESIVRSTSYLKDFQLKMVDGAGHFPQQEDHTQVNSYLADFLFDDAISCDGDKSDNQRGGLIGSLVSSTFKYGNSFVDNVKKTTNGVVWKTHLQ